MNKIMYHLIGHSVRRAGMIPLAMLVGLLMLLTSAANAQTVVAITNPIPVIFGGAGVTAVYPGYTNSQVAFTLSGGTDLVNLRVNVVGSPAGVTAGFVGGGLNPNSAANIAAVTPATASTNLYLSVSVVNAAKGNYPLEIIADNTVTLVSFTNSRTLLVLPDVFSAQAGSADTNWSTDANWSVGTKPVTGDSARYEYTGPLRQTNVFFDTSIVLDSLLFSPRADALIVTNYFAPGVTLAVSGSNGFYAGADVRSQSPTDGRLNLSLIGDSGSLVVTNPDAVFSLLENISDNGGGNGKISMMGLGNLRADVKIAGIGSAFSAFPNTTATAQQGVFELAKTNFIRATYVGDYSGFRLMTNSIMFINHGGVGNGNFASTVNMGITNVFYADSISAITHQSGSSSSSFRFNPAFTNANNCVAVFRGTNGGLMSFFGVGIESGFGTGTTRDRGVGADFRGGRVDMLVDTMWLAHGKTNFANSAGNANGQIGALLFDRGVININTLRLGYHQWTNNDAPCQGTITVGGFAGTNASLFVNNLIELGNLDLPQPGIANTIQGFGKIVINTNGVVRANTIIAGVATTNNTIAINNGGTLIMTNTIGTSTTPISTLTLQGAGRLVLNATLGVTNCFVNRLTDASGAKIDIASFTGFSPTVPATHVLISYTAANAHNISMGTYPAGYNNVTLFDNTTDKVIELRVQTNAPAVLRWRGYVNNVWDHTTPNWQNTNSGAQVAFVDADSVIFENSNGVPTTVSITDFVIPNTGGTGIYMTNSGAAFTFENGGGQIGTCSMVKDGSADFTNNATGSENAVVNGGGLRGSGSMGAVTIASGANLDFSGTINGSLVTSGSGFFNFGAIANGGFTIQGGAAVTNYGTVQGGALTVNSNSLLVNAVGGWLKNIGANGSVNVAAAATLVNFGDIGRDPINDGFQANTLTVSGTFKDMGVGNIFLTTATINGGSLFVPGGDGIGTTKIQSAGGVGVPGRLLLSQNSTNIFKIDIIGGIYTRVNAGYQDYGGSASIRSQNGCTIIMTNITGSFAAGQSYTLFQNNSGGNPNPTGQGTNTYPVIIPPTPGSGLAWDLTQLWPSGIIGVTTNIGPFFTNTFTILGRTNIVGEFSWDAANYGWRLQNKVTALGEGVDSSNAWTTVPGGSWTNTTMLITNTLTTNNVYYRLTFP